MAAVDPSHPSRSQAQRRATTQAALLDATLDSLADVGWAGTTTRSVAERAGVSQGAQQHYFPTKTALVTAALQRLAQQLADAALDGLSATGPEHDRLVALLDRLWEIHNLPLNVAFLELLAAARTDPAFAPDVALLVADATALTLSVAGQLAPSVADDPHLRDWLLVALAAMRGTVLVALSGDETSVPSWPVLRALLLRELAMICH